MARPEPQVQDSLAAVLRLHSSNGPAFLFAERHASPGRTVSRYRARLDGRDRVGRKPDGELRMPPLQQGVLRELVFLQAAQAELRSLKKYQFSKNALLQRGHAKLAIRLPAHAIAPIQASAIARNGAPWRSVSFSR